MFIIYYIKFKPLDFNWLNAISNVVYNILYKIQTGYWYVKIDSSWKIVYNILYKIQTRLGKNTSRYGLYVYNILYKIQTPF